MYRIINTDDIPHRKDEYFPLFYEEWSIGEEDRAFHEELLKYTNGLLELPRFYVVEYEEQLIACYALLVNDIHSRQDLFPWFAYLYVKPEHRGKGLAKMLLQHGEQVAYSLNFKTLYLESNHEDFYEKFGYKKMGHTSDPFGEKAMIFYKHIEAP